VRFFFAAFAAFLMFLRAARRCFDDAIFVTSISSLDLTLRYRATTQQQTWEIQVTNQRRKVDAFRLKRLAGMLDKRAVTLRGCALSTSRVTAELCVQ
jgi:hypothetical protein